MASARWGGPIDPTRGLGVPIHPVLGEPSNVTDAEPISGLGIKASLRGVRRIHADRVTP